MTNKNMRKILILAAAMAALSARGASDVRDFGVSGDEYLDLVEAAVAAYPDDHVEEYIDDADRNGVHEHGFPRLAANIAALVSAGRHREWSERLRRMMDICCRDAKKGPMKKDGNEFSVKELVNGWGTDPAERAFYRAFRDVNHQNDLGIG